MNRFCIFSFVIVSFFASVFAVADDASTKFNAAKSAFDIKQFAQACDGFSAYLTLYPSNAQATEAKFYLAESFLNLKQYTQAEGYYQQLAALGLNDQYARIAMFRLGDIPYIQGNFDAAKPRLEEFVEKLDRDSSLQFVLYYLGDIAMRRNIPEEAEHYFKQSVQMFPQGARIIESQIGLAWAKNQLGKQTEANDIFQSLMNSTDTKIAEQAAYQWGVALFERGNYQEALTALTGFQTKYPSSSFYADSQRVIARCKGRQKDFTGALQVLSQIAQPSIDDNLMKVRCLYGLKQTQEANNILGSVERVAGPAYRDEIGVLKSVFLYDQKNWAGTISTLESILLPQYDVLNDRMVFNYQMLTNPAVNKLPNDSFLKACSLLALSYARNGENNKANAALREIQNRANTFGNTDLYAIASEASNRLNTIYQEMGTSSGITSPLPPLAPIGGGQWTDDNRSSDRGKHRPNYQGTFPVGTLPLPIGTGSDLEQFWMAKQQFDNKNYAIAVQQLERLLLVQYNQWTTPKQLTLNYLPSNESGKLNAATFAKASSLYILSKAQTGDYEAAGLAFSSFASRIQSTDSVQQNLLLETQNQLTILTNGKTPYPVINNPLIPSALTDTQQRKVLRECNTLFSSGRFDQADVKLRELLASKPSEAVAAEALLLQSKAVFKLGRDPEAIALLESVLDQYPASAQAAETLWHLGFYYYETCGDSANAVRYFQQIIEQFPNSKNIDGALYYVALDDLENGNGRTANTNLLRIDRNYQNGRYWSHALWTLAYQAYNKRNYTQAEVYVQKLLNHPPDVAVLDRTLYLKGQLALKKNEFDTAFVAFREIGKLCPESPLYEESVQKAQLAAAKVGTLTR